jgi:hypothetical protein
MYLLHRIMVVLIINVDDLFLESTYGSRRFNASVRRKLIDQFIKFLAYLQFIPFLYGY